MYEVTTAIKTIITTFDLDTAMRIAEDAFVYFCYVEVKEILSAAPWQARSVKVLMR